MAPCRRSTPPRHPCRPFPIAKLTCARLSLLASGLLPRHVLLPVCPGLFRLPGPVPPLRCHPTSVEILPAQISSALCPNCKVGLSLSGSVSCPYFGLWREGDGLI
ncbi:uncharacterized protein B0I36DRAFT_133486 [Microdochium trichocladiopsis]|uniref:Uncharacterized protein n=1 Tax=Microdochium trichocladiopsis TaxID=1682393 RepID=A0A9P8Y535_9PEZI|nr:uncharacterized protein B0I36DRAFT_133486 [Microdochium trichocladiopsis]KAH7029524.1 hypothetical protein B0I36DRAFT_133486 [Microdochium trichocladiopsis]